MSDYLWHRDGVIYQIYPRSFADSNDDGVGDLPGIASRLDYLAELGIDAVWLSPVYPSPDADFGYDVADHTAIDPKFGTLDDFDLLLREAHGRGIRVVLDLVLNHTSDRHPWFIESRSSRDNPKRDWYIWRDPRRGGGPPNNWLANFGGKGWTFDRTTGQYYFHMFLPAQPDLNWRHPEVRKAQLDVVRFWLDRGVDGFRLDAFNAYFKDDLFRDDPLKPGLRGFDRRRHLFDVDRPEMMPLLRELRAILDAYPERYAVGETFAATARRAAGYVGPDLLHAAFSFDFTESDFFYPWNPDWIMGRLIRREVFFTGDKWPTTALSNHDLPRTASRYCRGENDDQAGIAMAVLLTARGTPFLYYGEEIGMRNVSLRRREILDPPGRRYWPVYKGRDGCRTPMQWDGSANGGFSGRAPWLPVHPDYARRNVAAQREDPGSLFHLTRELIALRKEYPALRRGNFVPLECRGGVLAYLRCLEGRKILIALNFKRRPAVVRLDESVAKMGWKPLYSSCGNGTRVTVPILKLGPSEILLLSADS